MSLFTGLRSLDQKFSWSFLGFAFGILFFLVSLYTTFFYSKRPGFNVEILSDDPVYNIRENVSTLDIYFNGESIRQKRQMLSLLNLRVVNTGNADISKGSYDENSLPKFKVLGSRIITIEPAGASNEYLKQHGRITKISDDDAVISPVILEQNQFFYSKVLVIHPDHIRPELQLSGKVEGVAVLQLTKATPAEERSFLTRALSGDFVVQFTRIVVYLVGGVIGVLVLGVSFDSLSSWLTARKRSSYVKRFKAGIGYELSKTESAMLERYKATGERFVVGVCDLLRDSEALNLALSEAGTVKGTAPSADQTEPMHETSAAIYEMIDPQFSNRRVIRFLLDAGIVKVKDGKAVVDAQAFDLINRFESFLLALVPARMKRPRSPVITEETLVLGDETSATSPSQAPEVQ